MLRIFHLSSSPDSSHHSSAASNEDLHAQQLEEELRSTAFNEYEHELRSSQAMESRLLIPQITTKKKQWSCKVCVIEKLNTRESKSKPGTLYKPITLQDEAGNKVQGMTYQNDIELLDERLIVSNALVSRANQFFNVPDEMYRFVWSINRKTLIQAVDNDDQLDLQPSSDMDTKPFGQLYDYKSKRQAINIIGVVISKLPREFIVTNRTGQQKANDFVIVDEELKPIIFTMWGNFTVCQGVEIDKELRSGDYPVVLGRRITVTPYQGISLSTRTDSGVEVNPFGKRADALKEWAKTNSLVIERLIVEKAHNNAGSEMASPLDQQISPISYLKKSFEQSKGVWVKSKITLIDNGNLTYYIGCNNCDKKINCNDEGIKFQCMFCGHGNAVSIKRTRAD
ncbi:replication protein A 70 kDa DNA-binding subunit C-like isoform X3 [Ipomoea triloba]|uniref:replication protein A 70 kDa DNA-binding subunit C-like isoform X3 n=1 Tax=Ipomoea triloba TaxID=35885 RepID=UPI00125CD94D|nr:replication protein A 70 kDa DNA-binding subunit C-like isoform X3 [Ipomoea triloba]